MAPIKKDAVHRYFKYDKSSNTSTCELCQNKLKGNHATNLKCHLATKHTNEFKVVDDLNTQNKIARLNESTSSQSNLQDKIENLKKLCVRLVTVHGRPLAMMEDEAFQEIINIAAASDVASQHTNIKTIKNNIRQQAIEIRNNISNEVKNQMISLKLDSATCLERKFIGVNVQYIKEAEIVVRNLAVIEVHERQTSDFLKTTVNDLLTEFKILPDQLYSICTDNGSNMIRMVKLMGGMYISEDYQEEGGFTDENEDSEEDSEESIYQQYDDDDIFNSVDINVDRFIDNDRPFKVRGMLCAAHTLQLAVKDALSSDVTAQATTSVAKVVVNLLRKPNNANRLFQAKLRKPIKDCPTRWTSTYNMLLRLITLKTFCNEIPEIATLVSDEFWKETEDLIKCFQPANEATLILQRQQLTIGDFYITWLNCKNKVAVIEHQFANALHTSMAQREIKLFQNDIVLETLYMDSRLNVLLSLEQCRKARTLLKEVHRQSNVLKARDTVLDCDTESIQLIHPADNPTPSTSTNFFAVEGVEAMLRTSERARGNLTERMSFNACLHDLCVTPRINLKENIIMHWLNKNTTLSEIATVAKIVLGAPATQVSVERLFSSLKFVLHPLRSNISPTLLKDLMLVRANKNLL